jgi:hypothetical protein
MLDSPRLIPGDDAFGGRNETGTERPLVAQARRCVTVPTLPRSCRWPTKRRLLIEITPWLEWIAPVETRYGARRHACGRDRSEGLPSRLASLFAGARIGGAARRRRTVRNLRGRAQRRQHHRGAQHRTPIRGRSTAAARDLISADSLARNSTHRSTYGTVQSGTILVVRLKKQRWRFRASRASRTGTGRRINRCPHRI